MGTAQVADAVDLYVRVHNCVEQAGPGSVTNEHSQSSSFFFGNASTMWSHTQPIKGWSRKDYKQGIIQLKYNIYIFII